MDSSGLDLDASDPESSVVPDLSVSPEEPEFAAGGLLSRECVWTSTLTFAGGCGVGCTMTGVEDGAGKDGGVCTSTLTGGAGVVIVVLDTGTAVVVVVAVVVVGLVVKYQMPRPISAASTQNAII